MTLRWIFEAQLSTGFVKLNKFNEVKFHSDDSYSGGRLVYLFNILFRTLCEKKTGFGLSKRNPSKGKALTNFLQDQPGRLISDLTQKNCYILTFPKRKEKTLSRIQYACLRMFKNTDLSGMPSLRRTEKVRK